MKYDKRLRKLENHYNKKIIRGYFGTFKTGTDSRGSPIDHMERIITDLRKENSNQYPEGLHLLTPEEHDRHNIRHKMLLKAFEIARKDSKSLAKRYKVKEPRRRNRLTLHQILAILILKKINQGNQNDGVNNSEPESTGP